jgi:hypothetical protein
VKDKAKQKPTVFVRNLSVSRVFPVDDSAKVESLKVSSSNRLADTIEISA